MKEVSDLEEKNERKRMNITLPPELIEELEKVNKKYKINKSKQLETLVRKYLRKEY
ncbi:TPA: ribbon-helix-helix domain-containing protein, partial [Staphylococcus aureus]|nr:ribbon-helix-helix domain-containing protein [Staphylococcus aureus]